MTHSRMGLWRGTPGNWKKNKVIGPQVVRKGYRVVKCQYNSDTKDCLGSKCKWIKFGTCKFFSGKYLEI